MDDFRFVHSSGGVLNYWIDQSTAGFWVNVSTLTGNGNTDIWMYYGNGGAIAGSSVSGVWGTGLCGFWTLNEESGGTAKDSSGNGNNGTATGTSIVNGKFGRARNFNGTSDYVNTNKRVTEIGLEKDFTIELWFYNNGSSIYYRIFSDHNGATGTNFQTHGANSNGKDFTFYGPGVVGTPIITDFNLNQWGYLTIIGEDSVISIYRNGALVNESSNSNSFVNYGSIGFGQAPGDAGANYYFNGILDEIRIYSRALLSNEIKTHADVGNATVQAVGAEEGKYYLAANYKANVLNSGADGTKVHDVSWNPSVQSAGTEIKVSVRSSNSSFASGDITPLWTSVSNGGNPAMVGRYIQWMSTFTTTSSTTTPRIEDITLTYTSPPSAPAIDYNAGDSYTQITWKWADNSSGQYQEDGLKVYSSTGGILKTLSADATCWTEAGLKRNTKYSRYIQSHNTAGSNNSPTANKKTQPCVWQEKTTTRTWPNAFGFEGDGIWTWKVPANGGSLLTITAYVRYNSDYGGAAKPKFTLYNYGVNSSAQMTGAADTWEKLTVSGTPTGKGVLFLKVEGFSTAVGAQYFVDDIQVSQP